MRMIMRICLKCFTFRRFFLIYSLQQKDKMDWLTWKLCQKYDRLFFSHSFFFSYAFLTHRLSLKSNGEREYCCKRKIPKNLSDFGEKSSFSKDFHWESLRILLSFYIFFSFSFSFFLILSFSPRLFLAGCSFPGFHRFFSFVSSSFPSLSLSYV